MKQIMNHNEYDIRKNFRQSKDVMPTSNPKIEPQKRTTEILLDGSKQLLKEDKTFLENIYDSN